MTTKKEQETIIDAPISLSCLFIDSSDDEDDVDNDKDKTFEQNYEINTITLTNKLLKIRQFAYHSHNANRVWPGTFALSDYVLNNDIYLGNVLELGSATGIISIRLAMEKEEEEQKLALSDNSGCSDINIKSILTSDVNDEYGDVEENIKMNFELNGFEECQQPAHVPHTWGSGWKTSVEKKLGDSNIDDDNNDNEFLKFDTIIASDILLYVSAYPLLVQTLKELFENDDGDSSKSSMKFIMSWNRRIKDSKQFFDLMVNAGFNYTFHGNGLYTFVKKK